MSGTVQRWSRRCVRVGLLVGAILPAGCLERKETIRVLSDGGVELSLEVAGDPGDLDNGDVLPEPGGGWRVRRWMTTKQDGQSEAHLEAQLHVPRGEPIPDAYVPPQDPNYEAALRFPTQVRVEVRPDGTYYHFTRVYRARPQARYEYHRERVAEARQIKSLEGKDPAQMTDEERRRLVEMLRDTQALKMIEFVRAGGEAMSDVWPQHYELRLRRALLDFFEGYDLSPLLARLAQPEDEQRNAEINRFGEDLLRGAEQTLERTLHELHVPRSQVEAFLKAYRQEQARRAVTEDLLDERWKVAVELPGEIVAHNGDRQEGHRVEWEFDAKALMDRDQVLMATSRADR